VAGGLHLDGMGHCDMEERRRKALCSKDAQQWRRDMFL
jgi:hypothetical protein